MAVGSWVFGSVAERHGLSVALLTVAAIQLLGMALSQRISLPETGNLNLAPGQWKEPTPTLTIESRSGPIVDTTERSEEHTSELHLLMRLSYSVFSFTQKI